MNLQHRLITCFAVLILCGEEDTAFDFMMTVRDHDMVTDEYAYIYLDMLHRNTLRPWQVKSRTMNKTLMDAFIRFHPVSNLTQEFMWLNVHRRDEFSHRGGGYTCLSPGS